MEAAAPGLVRHEAVAQVLDGVRVAEPEPRALPAVLEREEEPGAQVHAALVRLRGLREGPDRADRRGGTRRALPQSKSIQESQQ